MAQDRKFTAYCGLYCLDCIPANKSFFRACDEFEKLLSDLKFDKYAEAKSKTNKAFRDYPKFASVLKEIKKLECTAPCQEGGCKPDCRIRECVQNKRYEGCWECDTSDTCDLLLPLKRCHGGTIDHNLEMIRRYGPDNWSDKRGKHYIWS